MSKFNQAAAEAAKTNRPWLVVFEYGTGSHEQGEVLSRHSTYELANKAARKSAYDSFLSVRDSRDYA